MYGIFLEILRVCVRTAVRVCATACRFVLTGAMCGKRGVAPERRSATCSGGTLTLGIWVRPREKYPTFERERGVLPIEAKQVTDKPSKPPSKSVQCSISQGRDGGDAWRPRAS
eukprot:6970872-Prymnesium_polylepis.1